MRCWVAGAEGFTAAGGLLGEVSGHRREVSDSDVGEAELAQQWDEVLLGVLGVDPQRCRTDRGAGGQPIGQPPLDGLPLAGEPFRGLVERVVPSAGGGSLGPKPAPADLGGTATQVTELSVILDEIGRRAAAVAAEQRERNGARRNAVDVNRRRS